MKVAERERVAAAVAAALLEAVANIETDPRYTRADRLHCLYGYLSGYLSDEQRERVDAWLRGDA